MYNRNEVPFSVPNKAQSKSKRACVRPQPYIWESWEPYTFKFNISVNFPASWDASAIQLQNCRHNIRKQATEEQLFPDGGSCPKLMRIGKVVFYLQGRRAIGSSKNNNKLRAARRANEINARGSDHNYAHYLSLSQCTTLLTWLSQRASTGVMTFAWAPPHCRVWSESKKRGRLKNTHTHCFALSSCVCVFWRKGDILCEINKRGLCLLI